MTAKNNDINDDDDDDNNNNNNNKNNRSVHFFPKYKENMDKKKYARNRRKAKIPMSPLFPFRFLSPHQLAGVNKETPAEGSSARG